MLQGADTVPFVFFQAEDGIRAGHVTGVQTCALPIFAPVQGVPISPASWPRTSKQTAREALMNKTAHPGTDFLNVRSNSAKAIIIEHPVYNRIDRKSVV